LPTIENPYNNLTGGSWVKGNLHAHSTRSDGNRSQQAVIDCFAELGYDYLAITDHDVLTGAKDYEALDCKGLILVPGNEISADGPHLLHIDATSVVPPSMDRQEVFDAINRRGGFAIVNHPNWIADFNHCPYDLMARWKGYTGMEIFNGVVQGMQGSAYATDKWDRILSTGRRVWGFANDDSHAACHDAQGWNVAYVTERTPGAVVDALSRGRFYASTGVVIDEINVDGRRISVHSSNAEATAAYIQDGTRINYVDEPGLEIDIPKDSRYVRFEFYGKGNRMAWTQPMFVKWE